MNLRLLTIVVSLLGLVISSQVMAAEESCFKLPDSIERSIKKHEKVVRGAEYCKFRDIAEGDLNFDKIQDIAIIYRIEGACGTEDTVSTPGSCGNHHETYLIAFLGKGKNFRQVGPLQVGGRGQREFRFIQINNGRIEAETLEYGVEDPQCCPSKEGRTIFVLSPAGLVEEGRL